MRYRCLPSTRLARCRRGARRHTQAAGPRDDTPATRSMSATRPPQPVEPEHRPRRRRRRRGLLVLAAIGFVILAVGYHFRFRPGHALNGAVAAPDGVSELKSWL